MKGAKLIFLLLLSLVLAQCSSDSQEQDQLQSECVHNFIDLDRNLIDGMRCFNFSYSDCGGGPSASECINYCAFEMCQSGPCEKDADCSAYGTSYECQEYTVSGTDYGQWCGESDCPKGTQGCPCLDLGDCYDSQFIDAFCEADNICSGTYTCTPSCIVGSVCCGGAFCSGNCIGTPCCSQKDPSGLFPLQPTTP